jgi:tryptophanyl-tRNA synthetase
VFAVLSERSIGELLIAYAGKGYGEFKADLAETLIGYLRPLQERHRELSADPAEIARLLEIGAARAQTMAAKTLADVYQRVGFLPRA